MTRVTRRAEIGGVTLAYDDAGEGDALVLVHGHPFNRTMWRPQIDHFSQLGWRVVTPDLRGYGESTVVAGKTTLERFARDLAELLDHLRLDRAVLGGLSMGGQIVMEFHRLFPNRLLALVLADTSPHAETKEGKRRRNEVADRLLREGMASFAGEVLPKMLAPANIAAQPSVAAHVLEMMRTTSAEGAAAALRGRAERPDYVRRLSRVSVPTLIVVGSEDEFTPVADAEFMHEQIPASTLAVIDGPAHMPNLERPAQFNSELDSFLDRFAAADGAARADRPTG